MSVLSQLHAKDGVFSVLGNHDYPTYLDCDEATKAECVRKTKMLERKMGWQLLLNEHQTIRRDSDSIVIAGMENWGTLKRMPRLGDVKKTMAGVSPSSFVLMLQHDPTAWRKKILPECHAQLTLSGHTHGGQFSIFGWSPASFTYDVWGGSAYEGDRAIYVSTGLGALIPFRLNMPGEIVVITLKSKKVKKIKKGQKRRHEDSLLHLSGFCCLPSHHCDDHLDSHPRGRGLCLGQWTLLGLLSWPVVGSRYRSCLPVAREGGRP